ncbi:Mrp/NBP35 family ATP-binding protein [Corynebacterium sp. CCM 8835]|uniref:Iron-sulfur cluster carrier protein n=1 Tax=Corynebacterium antarcticum TaxID=2800405 RepID=A0ABS1FND0_9CORY|nr:Mrp/NBP35 family ATP-binding protein [Corynebacterium antarcticum]MCK7642942.1 Mrp/NBP35 family ATP-binding protein [Corynebacterium antarcticum]MCK7661445.1 Mrp/NBP35 family ATP-binding protein [Corynebacterium antarcticum]MCL0246182.1 Mrp/NBP35 family ATP-binding protein [Corynebacterium antarcticum]MCX7492432.1 Mrp/NBP35 family ATP-binding protein [Corynebacterium antarcticum]MCX7540772.1 Mrp/NBP35 family ATP-binding protein [Corynebacterium antarcticum]
MTTVTESEVRAALARVIDPEIGRPITELGMVKSIAVDGSSVQVEIYLTIAGCPMKSTLTENSRAAVAEVDGVTDVTVTTDVMSDEQRRELRTSLRGNATEVVNPFAQPGCTTRIYAVASGKGGVGKSSMTVNLAAALAARGLSVGVLDADIYGHSIPHMLGSDERPHQVDDMIMPPMAHGVKMISIGHFVEGNSPVVWRGPMLHRAITQFLTDVFWGDLDVLLLDLPPGTGDVAISVAQLVPNAELLIVTTPQAAAAEVAERAGSISQQTRQRIAGVIENMGAMVMPDGSTVDVFGAGGGQTVADRLSILTGTEIDLLGEVPLDPALRAGGDVGVPVVIAHPESPTSVAIGEIADRIVVRRESLAGKSLNLGVANKPR